MTRTHAAPPVLLTDAVRWARGREAAFVGAMLAFLAAADPNRPLPFDVCLWHRLTGYRCLTCGLTRSVCHAIRGDWAGSFALHPAGVITLVLLAGWCVRSAFEASTGTAFRAR
jgi:hypothetical protein